MYDLTDRITKFVEAHIFTTKLLELEAREKLARLQNLEMTWQWSDAYDTNSRYVADGEKLAQDIRSFTEQHARLAA